MPPLSLPAKLIAWNRKLQTRVAWSSLNQVMGDTMYTVATEIITTRAFTCKGSSTGTVAAMDGVYRWASGNDAKTRFNGSGGAQSWLAGTLAGLRGDFVFSYNAATDDVYNIWWSPGGLATVAGTATFEPTATDQILLNKYYTTTPGTIIGTNTANDRLVSIWTHPNKGGFRVAIACNGAWASLFGITQFTADTYGAGITVIDATGFYINGAWDANANSPFCNLINASGLTNQAASQQKRFVARRTDGGGTTLDCAHKTKTVGQATTSPGPSPGVELSFAPELQGGAIKSMKSYGLYSVTATARGDVGWLIDWYLAATGTADGVPTGALEWICVESTAAMFWDWDGSTAVVMS